MRLMSCSRHRLTRTRQILPISSSKVFFHHSFSFTEKCAFNIRLCTMIVWAKRQSRLHKPSQSDLKVYLNHKKCSKQSQTLKWAAFKQQKLVCAVKLSQFIQKVVHKCRYNVDTKCNMNITCYTQLCKAAKYSWGWSEHVGTEKEHLSIESYLGGTEFSLIHTFVINCYPSIIFNESRHMEKLRN